ncbi:aflatoxin biosynthesis ketoreductase nor-1 [Plenodomus tracheiphilus IPT5]|uniref:Aflatoxin biosynthesis ketoreductase nor-1 n=1 Tax=Plenodomus tracheiphilus IPT5 TaxID=1408161 RepID=A0A6A7B3F5_9PLEO|nr:aflatoxin biosynthesis ketoreductase nor-1 [Plenodomus tracheiphilus IPT5]
MSSTVVLITGVGKGIGATLARTYLTRPNHTVIGSVRDESTAGVAELKSFATADNSKLLLVHIDSGSVDDPKKALTVVQGAGIEHVDVVIANAGGYSTPSPIDSVGREELIGCFETNAAAPMLLFQTFKPLLQKASAPKWIVMSTSAGSIGYIGVIGSHFLSAYGASKAALNWLTQAIHVTNDWLTVVALHPGLVQTGPGNWVAKHVGLEQAPTTIEDSASSIVKLIDNATRDGTSGKFISALEGTEIPW